MTSPATTTPAAPPDLLTEYADAVRTAPSPTWPTAGRGIDELLGDDGRTPTATVLAGTISTLGIPGLQARSEELRQLIADDGITYGLPDAEGEAHPWQVDPLPVIIDAPEWAELERGLQQRARLLDAVYTDLYTTRRLISSRIIAPEIVYGHPGFLLGSDRLLLPGPRQVPMLAVDLARSPQGGWMVLGDRTQSPSGAGYAMATRRVTARAMEELHLRTQLRRLRGFFDLMHLSLQESAPEINDVARVVLLTPGTASETSYDQAMLSTLLGYPLAQSDDLVLRGGRLWLRTTGRLEAVDVVLRRVDADYADSLDLRPDSRLGVPGLMSAQRMGRVSVVNPLGSGVLENPGLWPQLDAIARALCDEDLLLPAPQTWWCGDPAQLSHVRARLTELVIKPLARHRGRAEILGWQLSTAEREDLLARIDTEPWAWTAQEPVTPSTVPLVGAARLEARSMVLRTFGVALHGDYEFMPGGLARVAAQPGTLVVANRAGALAKDVWVLESEEFTRIPRIDRSVLAETRLAMDEVLPTGLTPRGAENLYWMGRYVERAELGARLVMVTANLVEDNLMRPGTPGHAAMQALVQAIGAGAGFSQQQLADPPAVLRQLLIDLRTRTSVAYSVRRAGTSAAEVRELLPLDTWAVLNRLHKTLQQAARDESSDPQRVAGQALESLLAVSGMAAESVIRDPIWAFQDAGRRVERAQAITRLVPWALGQVRPPVIGTSISEAVLRAADSLLSYRRRMASGVGHSQPAAALAHLLLLDPSNPRSLVFQLERLLDDFVHAPDNLLSSRVRAILGTVREADVLELCGPDRTGLVQLLSGIGVELAQLSEQIERVHFAAQPSAQSFTTVESRREHAPWL